MLVLVEFEALWLAEFESTPLLFIEALSDNDVLVESDKLVLVDVLVLPDVD